MATKECNICGKVIIRDTKISQKQWDSKKYCSWNCKHKSQIGVAAWNKGKKARYKAWNDTNTFTRCGYCGKEYKISPAFLKKVNYCLKLCFNKGFRKTPWNKGLHIKLNNALEKWHNNGGEVWNKGLVGYKSGEAHYNWNGGSSKDGYTYQFRYILREMVRKSYGYRCQQCFRHQDELYTIKGAKYKLHIHHIDYNKKNNSIDNLITLCRNCHMQTNFGRDDWTKYFKNKTLEVNNA